MQFCIIGYPLGHTMSPLIHTRFFSMCERTASYSKKEIPPQALANEIKNLHAFHGCNVTIPHKQTILPFLDALDDRAALYGAVNTVAVRDGRLIGYNTDCTGFLRALSDAGQSLRGRVGILGAGGAARMMAFEAASAGAAVVIAVREQSLSKAQALAEELFVRYPKTPVSFCAIPALTGDFDLLLNGTPVGMYPHSNECPVTESLLLRCGCVFDAVYNPIRTQLLKKAASLGAVAIGGLSMLIGQAADAQEIWFGEKLDPAVVKAVEKEVACVLGAQPQ